MVLRVVRNLFATSFMVSRFVWVTGVASPFTAVTPGGGVWTLLSCFTPSMG